MTKLVNVMHRLCKEYSADMDTLSNSLAECSGELEQKLRCSFADCPLHMIPHYLQSALEACRVVHKEACSALPDQDRLASYTKQYCDAVAFFSHPSMLRPIRYVPKTDDCVLKWHLGDIVKSMADDSALSVGEVSSSALESANKHWKTCIGENVGGGRPDSVHPYANEPLVSAVRCIGADFRCMRQRSYVEQESALKARNASPVA